MVVHLSTGACEALKRAAITDPAYSGRRFRGRTDHPRSGPDWTTGGELPVRGQKLAVGNPAGSPTLRRSLLRRPLQRREFAAAGSPAFLTFSPGFLFSCRLFPHWSTASHPWAARLSQGIRNPCARFDIRLPHPPSSLWGRPSFFKNTNPPAGQIDPICPAGGLLHMLHHPNRSSNQLPPPSSG